MAETVHPIPVTPGLVFPFIGLDQPVGITLDPSEVTRLFLSRTDEAGEVVAELRNSAGDTLVLTLAAGVDAAAVDGSILFDAAETIILRVTASDTGSQSLGGSMTVSSPVVAAATSFLTTLARCKTYLELGATTDKDQILSELILWISESMELSMKRQIVETVTTKEIHGINSMAVFDLTSDHYPITSIQEVRENDEALVADVDYRVVGAGVLQRVSGSPPFRIRWSGGFVELDYTHGFASVPEALAGSATIEVAAAFRQSAPGGNRLGKSGEGGSLATGLDAGFVPWDLSDPTLRILAGFRRVA